MDSNNCITIDHYMWGLQILNSYGLVPFPQKNVSRVNIFNDWSVIDKAVLLTEVSSVTWEKRQVRCEVSYFQWSFITEG